MADWYFGINMADPEVESSVQVGTSSNSTDIEVRVTQNTFGGVGVTREEARRKLCEVIGNYIVSGLNTTGPVA